MLVKRSYFGETEEVLCCLRCDNSNGSSLYWYTKEVKESDDDALFVAVKLELLEEVVWCCNLILQRFLPLIKDQQRCPFSGLFFFIDFYTCASAGWEGVFIFGSKSTINFAN